MRAPLHLGWYHPDEPAETTQGRVELYLVASDLRRGRGFRETSAKRDRVVRPTRIERLAARAYP